MNPWLDTASCIEALNAVSFDAGLVHVMERQAADKRLGEINFHVPSFKAYATSEISGCGKSAWPAVSITGGDCQLQCDHCKAKVLEPMIAARTPDELWRMANEQIERGAKGMLLTGGSNRRNEVEYGPFYSTIRRIKDAFPSFRIALHTALTNPDGARCMEQAGVNVAMMDVIGAQDTVTQVYHLKRSVDEFEQTLAALVATRLRVVPHIVLGLHYGRFLGEWHALEMVKRHSPPALVLVVAMPFYAPASRPFAIPDAHELGRFFLDARAALPDASLLLGCARPAGRVKTQIDAYAVMAGLDGIAHPAEGMVEFATRLGRAVRVTPACCSIAIEDVVLSDDIGDASLRVDPKQIIERERTQRIRFPLREIHATRMEK
jgi:uncharacterized radical SAM superfamily protein